MIRLNAKDSTLGSNWGLELEDINPEATPPTHHARGFSLGYSR